VTSSHLTGEDASISDLKAYSTIKNIPSTWSLMTVLQIFRQVWNSLKNSHIYSSPLYWIFKDDNFFTPYISVSTITNIILVTSQNIGNRFSYYKVLVCIQLEFLHSWHGYQ
jgi:hypothetical protein